jgi:hypothetical protein
MDAIAELQHPPGSSTYVFVSIQMLDQSRRGLRKGCGIIVAEIGVSAQVIL